MTPLNLIYRKIDKKTGTSLELDDSINISNVHESFKLPNLIADRRISQDTPNKNIFPEINKSHI